jgi:site-specific DNA-methyltransferase (adenine-specific)
VVFCQVEAAMRWGDTLRSAGAKPKRIGVWIKPDAMPQFTGDRPGMGYESIVFAHAPGRCRWNGGGRVGVFSHNKNSNGGGPSPHPTTKPVSLMLELLELFTDPDEVVLDPFAGSATTGVACLRLGRRFIGIEKDAGFYRTALERMQAESQGLTLRAARAGQLPLFGVAEETGEAK